MRDCLKSERSMKNYNRTKYTCWFSNIATASVFSLPSMLFVTFHEMYGISYTLLGTLLLVNFSTQLIIDLVFTFFSQKFNLKATIRIMPLITSLGLFTYALVPYYFPRFAVYGLFAGTVIFSISAGLCEVLVSPLISALPSERHDKDLSILHSLYGWGVVTVVLLSSAYFKIFGTGNWVYLTLFWASLPLISSFLFFTSPIPEMNLTPSGDEKGKLKFSKEIIMCAVCIFLGSASENIMTDWISSFMEKSLLVPKAAGDVLGMAVFALLLASTRSVYAKFGKNIVKTLLLGMTGAAVCYIVAGCSPNVIAAFIASILIGVCTSMLWPGTLIMMEEKVPSPGVAAYALMAACGDLGASFGPQLTGIIVDRVSVSSFAQKLGVQYFLSPEQIGFKVGMLCAAVFPVLGAVWVFYIKKSTAKSNR